MKNNATGMNWNPSEVAYFRFGKMQYKRVVTKENRVYWFGLSSLHTWEKVTSPIYFGSLEDQRRRLISD
jgi:hypothetical protein